MRCEFLLPLKEAQRVDILPLCLVKGSDKKNILIEATLKVSKALLEQNHRWLNIFRSTMDDSIRFCEEKWIDGQVIWSEEYISLKEAYVGCFVRIIECSFTFWEF